MVQVSEIFDKAAEAIGVPVLTPDYEIVLALVDVPNLTADQLFDRSSLSRAGFFNTIERLKAWGIIFANAGLHDRRRRIYRLSGDLREIIFYRFRKYRADYDNHEIGNSLEADFISKDLTTKRDRGLDYFSCEFKILFYLYLKPNLPSHALRALIDTSETKFYSSLKLLLKNDLVSVVAGVDDRRLKQYNISCRVRLVMQKLHLDIFDWLDQSAPVLHRPAVSQTSGYPDTPTVLS